ncbi:MAG: GTP-binding protein [Veillonella sp.]|nr:GTP-binding protein [Veillonella sp.]
MQCIMIPVYVVAGLLGSGKTTLINLELRERKKLGSTEIISFETGITEFIKSPLSIEPDDIEENLHHVVQQIQDYLSTTTPKEIWVEWNSKRILSSRTRHLHSKQQQYNIYDTGTRG